jgi:hypothetical protein
MSPWSSSDSAPFWSRIKRRARRADESWMRRLARENAVCALLAVGATAAMAWLGLYGFAWNDYDNEARPAAEALVHGHLHEFLRLAPAYGGSLLERAPFALIPSLWGGGELAVYRLLALPCLLAAALLGAFLVARIRAQGGSTLARGVALGVCVANPLTLQALEVGHPEDLLGACLCVGAVILAARDRPAIAAVALGLAIANKEWALLAVGPVLLASPPGRRLAAMAIAATVAAAGIVPFALASSGGFAASTRALATPTSVIFQPWQVWWFLGRHGALVHGLFGAAKPGYRVGPAWTGAIAHPSILLVGVLVSGSVWLKARGSVPVRVAERTALSTLALVLLLRCLLDTWDTDYYLLPLCMALLAWQVSVSPKRPPLLALACTVLAWASFQWLPAHHLSPDGQALFFLAWTLPLAAMLTHALLAPKGSLVDDRELLRKAREPLVPVLAHDG